MDSEQAPGPRVHRLGPPDRTGALRDLFVNRVAYRTFDGDCEFLRDPRHRANVGVYLSDLLEPYGLALNEGLLDAGTGQSYGEMAEALVKEVVDEPVDLLVLAFAIPDVWPGRATATYLSHVCPGNPLSFAVCDQGVAGAYTGLRLVREYVTSGAAQRALLLIVEQSTLHYESTGLAPIPTRNAGVALLCTGRPGPTRLDSVRLYPDVDPEQAAVLLKRQLSGPPDGATLVAGSGLEPAGSTSLRVDQRGSSSPPAGLPYTGVWWQLAATSDGGPLVLADYDPALRYLCTATVHRYSGVE